MKHRLQFQIFGALIMSGLMCAALVCVVMWVFYRDVHPLPRFAADLGELIVDGMPTPQDPKFEREFKRRARRLGASMTLWSADGRVIARSGRRILPPSGVHHERGYARVRDDAMFVRLENGRLLGVSSDRGFWEQGNGRKLFGVLAFLGFVVLLGSHGAAHHIVRRLRMLEHTVSRFGAGDLSARVEIHGKDELARLGLAFNRNFARIGGLLRQQRRMLQSASHELRSPLTRLRMAFELATDPDVDGSTRERLRSEAGRDIEELDALISDLLMAARLSDSELPREFSDVCLSAVVREEAVKVRAEAEGSDVNVCGNARMLRSAVRNLLENARRYGKDPIVIRVTADASRVRVRVEDRGDGVPEADRERIFEPFYRPEGHREGRDGGVGLGLSLVRNIAEHHGGSVRYLPREGGGSVFELDLPCRLARPEGPLTEGLFGPMPIR